MGYRNGAWGALFITLAIASNGCGEAEYSFTGEALTSPAPNPGGNNENPGGGEPPTFKICYEKILLQVDHVEVGDVEHKRKNHRRYCDHSTQGVVDLCALSKDFVGTLAGSLNFFLTPGMRFDELRFVLALKEEHQILAANGDPICDLRVPSGSSTGISFESKSTLEVTPDTKIGFDFDSSTIRNNLENGICHLSPPSAHFELKSVAVQ